MKSKYHLAPSTFVSPRRVYFGHQMNFITYSFGQFRTLSVLDDDDMANSLHLILR